MNSKKLFFILVGIIVLLGIGMIAGAYQANTVLQKTSKTLADKKAQSAALDDQQAQLIQDKKDIATYTDLNEVAKSIVPQDKDQAEAVRQIVSLAHKSNIGSISSITFPASTLGGNGVSAKPLPANSAGNNLTQLTPVPGISGVYTLPITVAVTDEDAVPYSTFISFLKRLEQNRRTAQVSTISVTPSTTNLNNVSFTLLIDEYIKP